MTTSSGGLWSRSPLRTCGNRHRGSINDVNRGNRFIIVIGEYWTKWTEAYPVPDHTAPTVANHIVEKISPDLDFPERSIRIRAGNSRVPCSHNCAISWILKRLGTTPWHPSGNGLIERFNRTLGEMLRQRVSLHQKDWDEDLHLMTMAYRSTIHETTGMTP